MWKFFKVFKLSDSRAYLDTKACMESRGQTWSRLYLMVATHSCKNHARHKSTQLWGCIDLKASLCPVCQTRHLWTVSSQKESLYPLHQWHTWVIIDLNGENKSSVSWRMGADSVPGHTSWGLEKLDFPLNIKGKEAKAAGVSANSRR